MQRSTILSLLLAWMLTSSSQAGPALPPDERAGLQRGAVIYSAYCLACHGINGDGKGSLVGQVPAGAEPANLTTWVFQESRGDNTLRQAILGGGAAVHKSNSMPAWSQTLTDSQVDDLIGYVRGLNTGGAPDLASVTALDDELQIGKALYSIRCMACHGASGEGHGFLLDSLVSSGTASEDIRLPDFSLYTTIRGRSDNYFSAVITSGIGHSGLALQTSNGWWDRGLELGELRALIRYLRTLPRRYSNA